MPEGCVLFCCCGLKKSSRIHRVRCPSFHLLFLLFDCCLLKLSVYVGVVVQVDKAVTHHAYPTVYTSSTLPLSFFILLSFCQLVPTLHPVLPLIWSGETEVKGGGIFSLLSGATGNLIPQLRPAERRTIWNLTLGGCTLNTEVIFFRRTLRVSNFVPD